MKANLNGSAGFRRSGKHLVFWSLAAASFAPARQTAAALPEWLGDSSVTLKETYDGNVFLSGVNPQFYAQPALPAVPGSAVAHKNESAAVTTAGFRATLNLLPATGTNTLSLFTLAYAPEFDVYEGVPSETHYDHRLLGSLKGQSGPWSFGLEENFLYVDGSRVGPTYPGGYVTAFNVGAPRERRQQIQDRATATVRYDADHWFGRSGLNLTLYDLQTELRTNTGYVNYCSRYDFRGSVDAGYKVTPQTALTLGTQIGRQEQQPYSFKVNESSSMYYRILGGLEGHPLSWLTVKCQAGPDLRVYDAAAAVNARHKVTYYDEISAAARLSDADTLTLEGRQFQWVSSLGVVPYFDTSAALNWHHAFGKTVGTDLGLKFMSADYRSGDLVTCRRVDTETCLTAGVSYAVNRHLTVALNGEFDLGLNDISGVTNPTTRNFHRTLVSLGATWKF